jgi:hypothetical protein
MFGFREDRLTAVIQFKNVSHKGIQRTHTLEWLVGEDSKEVVI